MTISSQIKQSAQKLSHLVQKLQFSSPVEFVYNPLDYAWESFALYVDTYCNTKKRIIFLGMNPGPWGMAQTGIPFGEINVVKDWLNIEATVKQPKKQHPKRPIEGFSCNRSEVSGFRLWNLFKTRFSTPEQFFTDHFVANYCPLVFMEASSRNRTPDKLNSAESIPLFEACDTHLREIIQILEPEWLIGVGKFTEKRAHVALKNTGVAIGNILHPSPANPAANRDWPGTVNHQLKELKVWK